MKVDIVKSNRLKKLIRDPINISKYNIFFKNNIILLLKKILKQH